jgi:hypothetical protein
VVPLDLRHLEERIDEVRALRHERQPRRDLVFADVLRFEPARAVHRREPAAAEAEGRDPASDALHLPLARGDPAGTELGELTEDAVAVAGPRRG